MRTRADEDGLLGYSWVYWAATVAAFVFLGIDLFTDGARWNLAVVVCIIIAIAVRPGGIRGRRGATAEENRPSAG